VRTVGVLDDGEAEEDGACCFARALLGDKEDDEAVGVEEEVAEGVVMCE
jgi:hypothetical protein